MLGVFGPLVGALSVLHREQGKGSSGKYLRSFLDLLAHGLANAFIPFMPTLIMQKNITLPHFWIWVILTFLIGILITVLRDKKVSANFRM